MSIDELWAKSPKGKNSKGESLLEHSIRVAKMAQVISNKLPFSEIETSDLKNILFLGCALHDVGKIAKGFQDSLRPNGIPWGKRHEILSAAIVANFFPTLKVAGLFSIITHHKSIPADDDTGERCLPWEQLSFHQNSVWFQLLEDLNIHRHLLVEFLTKLTGELELQCDLTNLNDDFNRVGIGLSKFWLNRVYQREQAQKEGENLQKISLLRGLLISCDHLASAGEQFVPEIPKLKDHKDKILFKELGGKETLPFQERCSRMQGSGILKAPTGSGKTLGMLLWATNNQSKNGRLFYTLPYTASLNAMYKRMDVMFPKNSVGILHHKNAAFLFNLYEHEHSSNAQVYAKSLAGLARELYFPIKVLTPHQILKVVLRGKGWELGLAEFPNGCFVFDEIHAYEPFIVGLVVATAKWLQSMGAKLLFASATMPEFLEEILKNELNIPEENIIIPNPENEKDKIVCDKKRHLIEIKSGSLLSNLDIIIDEIRNNPAKKILIVCNYVATSQEVCKQLDDYGIHDYVLLHARFNSDDRNKVEQRIIGKNPPRILVATQAVEVSLDIDYDRGYTEPAPIDALAQRFGRINRKGSKGLSIVTVFDKDSVDNGKIYDSTIVKDTVKLLRKVDILSEYDLVTIINTAYKDGYKKGTEAYQDYQRGLFNEDINHFDEKIIAGTYRDWANELFEDKQIEVLPFQLIEQYKQYQRQHEYIRARMLLVPLRIIQFIIAREKGIIRFDIDLHEWITTQSYSSKLGLDLKKQFDNFF